MTSIAIDQSTSATKALLVDDAGRVLGAASLSHEQFYPQAGWVEHDAEEIWQNTLAVLSELLKGWSGESPSFLSITNQRETIVVFDKESGRPLRPAIVWQCLRSQEICQDLRAAGHEELIQKTTGLKLNPYFSGSKLAWLLEKEPETALALKTGRALVGTIDSYLIYRLTMGRVHATDPTNASRTLLMDLASQSWSDEMMSLMGVQADWLPEIRSCDAGFGATDLGGLLDLPIPICGVIGDAQGALLAQKCLEKGQAKATLGTGTFLLVQAGETAPPSGSPLLSSVAWKVSDRASFCSEGLAYISGAALVWLKDQAGWIEDLDQASHRASSVSDSNGVYLVPSFTGLGSPYWNSHARAAMVGMTLSATKAHILRAAFESIAYPVRDQIEALAEMGIKVTSLKVDGGATSNRWLMQVLADICQIPIIVCQDSNASALGAWSAGMLGMNPGLKPSDLPDRGGEEIGPVMPSSKADSLYAGWKIALKGVLAMSEPS